MESTFEWHQKHPDVSLEAYVREACLKLAKSLSSKKLVYFDTKYWITLQEAAQNSENQPTEAALLTALRTGVANGRILCPISASNFIELMKQTDAVSRQSMASLIDELSQGVALVDEEERIGSEVSYFIRSKIPGESLYPLELRMWCKLSYIFGIQHPTNTPFESSTELAIQKAFFDHMWSTPMSQVVAELDQVDFTRATDFDSVSEKLNEANQLHAAQIQTFAQVYADEIRGLIDLQGDTILQTIEFLAIQKGVPVKYDDEKDRVQSTTPFKNAMAFALARYVKDARHILRTIHIHACLHASVRWNKRRKLKRNDILDFHHAGPALAYCDAFFTERSLKTLVSQNHIGLDKLYECSVIASANEALSYIAALV